MKEQILKNYLIMASVILVVSSCFALINSGNQTTNSTTSKDIFESDEIIKSATNVEDNFINIEVPFREIYSIYRTKCSESSIEKANNQIESMKDLWNNDSKLENRSLDLSNKYIKIQNMLSNIDTDDKDSFCTQKYLLYNMLEETQSQYVNLTNTKLIKYTKIQGLSNNDTSKIEVNIHSAPTSIKFINLVNRTKDLSGEELDYANLADEYIQKEIWKLLERNFLTQEDLKVLDNKIVVNYNKTCANTKWVFHMLQSSDWKQKIFKSIILNVNLCDNKSFIQNYTNYIRQIFIHEISHYIYMFRDTWTANFDKICWDTAKGCTKENFVSNYANSNAAEDYAESFAYWYLDNFNWTEKQHGAPSNAILVEKLSYFDKLAQRLQN